MSAAQIIREAVEELARRAESYRVPVAVTTDVATGNTLRAAS